MTAQITEATRRKRVTKDSLVTCQLRNGKNKNGTINGLKKWDELQQLTKAYMKLF